MEAQALYIQEVELTSEQQSIVDLITTWEPKNVKLAIELDKSQNAGVEEIYIDFLEQLDQYRAGGPIEDKYLLFPIESCLFERCYIHDWLTAPRNINTLDELIGWVKKRVQLFGMIGEFSIDESSVNRIPEYEMLPNIINKHYNKKDFLNIHDFPF